MRQKQYNELEQRVQKLEQLLDTYINGGKGSGNFGHSGRPGEVGGSAPTGGAAAKPRDAGPTGVAVDYINVDPRGAYADGFDVLEDAQQLLVDKQGDWEEISAAYEDDARDFLDLPSRDQEAEGEGIMYMSDLADLQDRISEVIRSKTWDELESDLGKTTVESAMDFGLDKGGYEFASKNAELGQAGLSHDDAVRDLKSFIVDFKITDHYGAVKAAEDGDFKTAWKNISYDMRDKLKDEYDYDPLKENALKNATCNVVLPPEQKQNGGKGSGNFGHAGRPGEIGGSASMGSGASSSKKPSQGAELYKKIGESQKRAEKQEAIVKGFEKAAKAMDKLEKAFKKAKAGGSKADLAELVYDAQERVTDLYFLDDMKKADQKDRADYDKKQRELAVEIYKFTTGKEPKKMPPSRDEDIHFWGY